MVTFRVIHNLGHGHHLPRLLATGVNLGYKNHLKNARWFWKYTNQSKANSK